MEASIQNHEQVGHENFGRYAAIFNLTAIFNVFTDFGLNQFYTKSVASDPENAEKHFIPIFFIKTVLTVAYPAFMIGIGFALQYQTSDMVIIAILSLVHALIQYVNFFRANFQGYQLFRLDAIVSNLDKLLFVAFMMILLIVGPSITQFISIRLLSVLITLLIIIIWTIKKGLWFSSRIALNDGMQLLSKSLPFALSTVLSYMLVRVDQVMVERLYHDPVEAGLYSAAYRWIDAAMNYLWILLPMFFAKFAHHQTSSEQKSKMMSTGTVLTAFPMIALLVFVYFHGEVLFKLFDNSSESELIRMNQVFLILCYSLLINGFFAILSTFLTSNGHLKFVNYLFVLGIVVNFCTNFYFVPTYGAQAAAWTTVLSLFLMSIGYFLYILKKKLVKIPFIIWIKLVLCGLVYFFTFKALNSLALGWVLETLISGIFFVILIIASKTLTIKSLRSI